ncbi:MAG: hypothetical protein ACI802_002759 [Candidatus Paceibacteria bacterium]
MGHLSPCDPHDGTQIRLCHAIGTAYPQIIVLMMFLIEVAILMHHAYQYGMKIPVLVQRIAALDNIKQSSTGISSALVTFSPQVHAAFKGGSMAALKDGKVPVVKTWQE